MRAHTLLRCAIAALLTTAAATIPETGDAKPKRTKKQREKDREKKAEKEKEPDKEVDSKPPIITHVRVTRAQLGAPIVIRAKFDDESEIFAPSVYVRAVGSTGEFESLAMRRGDDGWEATVAAEQATQNVEYFIEAFDEQGNGPAREGSPEAPIRITLSADGGGSPLVPERDTTVAIPVGGGEKAPPADLPAVVVEDERPPALVEAETESMRDRHEGVASSWWFWTLIGLAVTGGAVATVLVVQSQGGGPEYIDVQVLGPDPTRGL